MRIGIDISQIVYEGTGVGNYVREMVRALLTIDKKNEYILFGASLRKRDVFSKYFNNIYHLSRHVRLKVLPIPPTLLDILWNKLHIFPVEWFIGNVDVFWSSDWTQPPLKNARGITTIHDLSVLRFPESFVGTNIVDVQKRRLVWAKKECSHFFCDSEATKKDAIRLLGLENTKLYVVYPGWIGSR